MTTQEEADQYLEGWEEYGRREREKAWFRIASHPVFSDCYRSDEPFIDAMIELLDEIHEERS